MLQARAFFFLVSGVLVLTGCGGGGGSESSRAKPLPTLSWQPSGVDFGQAQVGAQLSETFRITCGGSGSATGEIRVLGASFSLTRGGGPFALTTGQSLDVDVLFSPQVAGIHTGTLLADGAVVATASLAGSAVLPPPPGTVRWAPASQDFGSVSAGSPGTATLHLEHAGGGLATGSVTVSGAGFQITAGQGSFQLSAGQRRAVEVRCTPQVSGSFAGTLSAGGVGATLSAVGRILGPGLWPDQSVLDDRATLQLATLGTSLEFYNLRPIHMATVRYTSWEVVGGVEQPIALEAFFAIPNDLRGGALDAGVVLAHGLGGNARASSARNLAGRLGVAVIAYSGPGQGQSAGRGSGTPGALFDTVPDARGTWLWGHSVAGARALTALLASGEVDSARLGMTGYSAGAVATLNVNGFDDRPRCTVPVSGCGGWDTAAAAGSWHNDLLTTAGLSRATPEWQGILSGVDPINQAPTQHGAVLLINGAQDEFFPVDSTVRTFQAFPGTDHRMCIIADWDHGWFAVPISPYPYTYDNSQDAERKIEAGQDFWFGHHLTGNPLFPRVPPQPVSDVSAVAGFLVNVATLSVSYDVAAVETFGSLDGSWNYAGTALDHAGGPTWHKIPLPLLTQTHLPDLVWFTEWRLRASLLGPEFWLSSVPRIPPAFVPRIRPIQ